MSIKEGMLVFVKASGELAFVLKIVDSDPETAEYNATFKQRAHLRVPKNTHDSGIVHRTETFFLEELETVRQKVEREYEEMFSLQTEVSEKFKKNKKDALDAAEEILKVN